MDEDATGVISEQSPSSQQDEYSFLNDDGSVASSTETQSTKKDVKEISSTSSEDQEQVDLSSQTDTAEGSTDTPEAKAKAEAEAKAKEKTDETKKDPRPQENRRVRQAVARYNQEKEARQKVEFELERYKTAFKLLEEQHKSEKTKAQSLAEKHGEKLSPEQMEVENFRLKERIRQENERINKEWQERLAKEKSAERVNLHKERLLAEVEEAVAAYSKTVSDVELAAEYKKLFQQNPEAPLKAMDIAKAIHERKKKAYEAELAGSLQTIRNAPKPISQNGSASKRIIKTDKDLSDELDAVLGNDWNKR